MVRFLPGEVRRMVWFSRSKPMTWVLLGAVWMTLVRATVWAEPAVDAERFPLDRLEMPEKVHQGTPVLLRVYTTEPLNELWGETLQGPIPFNAEPGNREWWALLGVDLEEEPGPFAVTLNSGGPTYSRSFQVLPKSYGERRLRIAERELDAGTLERIRREQEVLEGLWKRTTPMRHWRKAFLRPVDGEVTGKFGVATFINDQRRRPHSGVDFRARKGENIRCSNDGRVVLVEDLFYAGISVFVDHGQGLYTMYFHLDRALVRAEDRVSRGQPIGEAGSTGRATGVHLHWGARMNGARIDPHHLLEESSLLWE